MKIKLFLLLLIPVFMNASDSKRLHEKVDIVEEEENGIITIQLVDKTTCMNVNTPTSYLGQVVCSNFFKDDTRANKENYIISLLVNAEFRNMGYGARLFKTAVARLHKFYPKEPITFDAFPLESEKKEDLEKLVAFYQRLGAQKDVNQKTQNKISMHYPQQKAAIMSSLLPILESEPPAEKPKHDPILIILDCLFATPKGLPIKHERTLKERAKRS